MKSTVVISVVAFFAAVANTAEYNKVILESLYMDENVLRCSADTGLVFGTALTTDTIARACGNSYCDAAKAGIQSLQLSDCTVDGVALETQFIGPIEQACKGDTTTTASPSTASLSSSSIRTPTSSRVSTKTRLASETAIAAMLVASALTAVSSFL